MSTEFNSNHGYHTDSRKKDDDDLLIDSYDLMKEIREQNKLRLERKSKASSGTQNQRPPAVKAPQSPPASVNVEKTANEEKLLKEILAQLKELNSTLQSLNIESRPKENLPKISDSPSLTVEVAKDAAATEKEKVPVSAKEAEELDEIAEIFTDIPHERHNKKGHSDLNTVKKKKFRWIGEVVFYLVLIAMIFGAFLIKSNSGGRPTIIAGYSAFTVLTGSMQDEIPQGTLVITKAVDVKSLEIGDDITYMVSETTSITHRIVGITESFQSTGERAFETQGIMNEKPDKELVPAANVVGKVVFHSEMLGKIAAFATKNWPFLLFLVTVIVILIFVLKWLLKECPSDESDDASVQEKNTSKRKHKKHS